MPAAPIWRRRLAAKSNGFALSISYVIHFMASQPSAGRQIADRANSPIVHESLRRFARDHNSLTPDNTLRVQGPESTVCTRSLAFRVFPTLFP
jgi:hypothetical protein